MKIFLRILAVFGVLIIVLVIYILSAWNKKYDAPYPQIKASKDPLVIARGKYLAYGPMHCATCHMPMENIADIDAGKELPLSGGWELDIPPGVFRSRNITPDMETGIGKLKDEEIARALRYGVGHDGRALVAFMPFQTVSDEDLTAIISFLRSQQPVKHELKPTEYNFLGKGILAFAMINREDQRTPPNHFEGFDCQVWEYSL